MIKTLEDVNGTLTWANLTKKGLTEDYTTLKVLNEVKTSESCVPLTRSAVMLSTMKF